MKKGFASLALLATTSALAAGAVWTAFPPEFQLESLLPGNSSGAGLSIANGSNEFVVELLGRCIAAIGDTNGDGDDDFLIGSQPFFGRGDAFVVYGGGPLDELAALDISELSSAGGGDGSRGRAIYRTGEYVGHSCSGAGDLNADGYSDFVLMGSQHYVVYGGPAEVVGAELDLATLEPGGGGDGSDGFQLLIDSVDLSRTTLDRAAGGGDFNNDGIDDIAVASLEQRAVYVIFGRVSGFPAAFDPDLLRPENGGDGTSGIAVVKSAPSFFGDAVGLIDDVNGDGIDDLAVTDVTELEQAHIVYGSGSTLPAQIDVADLLPANGGDGSAGIVIDNLFWNYIDDAGDFNGDGINDIVARGGPGYFTPDPSDVRVIFGGPSLPPYFDTDELLPENGGDGTRGVVIQGFRPSDMDFMGEWAAGVGDINGDGFDDIGVAGLSTDDSYVVFGSSTPPALLSLFDLTGDGGANGTRGFLLRGYDSNFVTTKFVRAGDVNADGRPDLLTSDWMALGIGFPAGGRVDIVFGRGDNDSDGIGDFDDNCIEVANTDQRDTDNDGFGNICDADLDNDLIVNFADLQMLRDAFYSTPADPRWNEDADFNGDGAIGFADGGVMRLQFFGAPGPSAFHNDKPLLPY